MPAERRSVAMRRPGWTASRASLTWSARPATGGSRSEATSARPQKKAGRSPPPPRSIASAGSCTTSRMFGPRRKNACRGAPAGVGSSRMQRRSSPAPCSAATVRSSAGVIATTWSSAVTPLGCAGDSPGGGRSDRAVTSPSSSVPSVSRSDQPASPLPASGPASRIRTSPTTQVSPSTAKPSARQASGGSATVSSSTVGATGSVAGALLHLLALGGMRAALVLQRRAGDVDVVGEPVDLLATQGLLDQRPHHLHVFGVGRHRVGGKHPAALGGELPGDVELVVVLLARELEGDQRQLLLIVADQLEVAVLPQLLRQRPGVLLHRLHDVGVALAPVADEVVVLGEHHRGPGGEVEGEGRVGLAQVVLVEDEILGQIGFLAEDEPADARVDEPQLVPGDVDRAHLLEPEVPLGGGGGEGPDEAAAGGVDVEGDVEAPVPLEVEQELVDPDDVVGVAGEGGAEHGGDADRGPVDGRLDVLGGAPRL